MSTSVTLPADKTSRYVGFMTAAEYFAWERQDATNQRYEFAAGKVFAVAGASPEHNHICFATARAFDGRLEAAGVNCATMVADQKVYVRPGRYIYPDALIVCGDEQYDDNDALRNPFVAIEVLSPSTQVSDRTDKLREYKQIETLRHYILIEQDRPSVMHYEKLPSGLWAVVGDYTDLADALRLTLSGAEITVPLARVYRRVTFPAAHETV